MLTDPALKFQTNKENRKTFLEIIEALEILSLEFNTPINQVKIDYIFQSLTLKTYETKSNTPR